MLGLISGFNTELYKKVQKSIFFGDNSKDSKLERIECDMYCTIFSQNDYSLINPTDIQIYNKLQYFPDSEGYIIFPTLSSNEKKYLQAYEKQQYQLKRIEQDVKILLGYDFKNFRTVFIPQNKLQVVPKLQIPNLSKYFKSINHLEEYQLWLNNNPNIYQALIYLKDNLVYSGQEIQEQNQKQHQRTISQQFNIQISSDSSNTQYEDLQQLPSPDEYIAQNFVFSKSPQNNKTNDSEQLSVDALQIQSKVIQNINQFQFNEEDIELDNKTPFQQYDNQIIVNNLRLLTKRPNLSSQQYQFNRDQNYYKIIMNKIKNEIKLSKFIKKIQDEQIITKYILSCEEQRLNLNISQQQKIIRDQIEKQKNQVQINTLIKEMTQQILEQPPDESYFYSSIIIGYQDVIKIYDKVMNIQKLIFTSLMEEIIFKEFKKQNCQRQDIKLQLIIQILTEDNINNQIVNFTINGYDVINCKQKNQLEKIKLQDIFIEKIIQIDDYEFKIQDMDIITKFYIQDQLRNLLKLQRKIEILLIENQCQEFITHFIHINEPMVDEIQCSINQLLYQVQIEYEKLLQFKLIKYDQI